ncbi:hypothetical protein BC739_008646 [Kutzneria viridogrisea]|uniref:RNA-directed DNA polymerase n=2 Tax=Kutzneria TaxID=43356 RepID=W5WJQ4_9PSEU|nr:reverse transcriptase family protein [Kutzneria albida]AHI01434.1 hypothetical protein KALB_8076 [Kutzneria albida DSM 43870]MBA8931394.1 hypothetical protein [Kutzneria viridogrisea]
MDDWLRLLRIDSGEFAWFADDRGWNRRAAEPLRHYRYRWMRTRSGGLRLIEAPKPRLAEVQRTLLRHLELPVHEAAHGFRRGRSVHTFAAPHAGRDLVLRMDLEGFFASVTATRVRALVGDLAGLVTTAAPVAVLRAAPPAPDVEVRRRLLDRLARPHLPQGAPSSPALANAVAHRLDRRITALADVLGATYTRYADDLAFSGDAGLPLHNLLRGVRRIAADEGFQVRPDKTRITPAHHRQRLTGLVVNDSPAASRAEYDELRAVLHNCVHSGPSTQNRGGHADFRAHLLGRIGWVGENRPARAAKLRALFDRITW